MITKKDIQIIKDCILKSGIKDSEFKKYEANLTGEEYITIVVDDNNYKVKVKDFIINSSTIIQLKGLNLPSAAVDMGSWPDYNNPLDGDYVFALNNLYKYVDGAWQEQLPSSTDIYAVYRNSLYKISYKDGAYTVTQLLMGGGDYDLSLYITESLVDDKIANALSRIPSNSDDVNDILTLLNGLNAKVIPLKAAEVTPDTAYSEAIAPISDTILDNGQQGDYVWTMNNGLQGFNPNSQSWETNYGVTDPNKTFVVWKNVVYKLKQNGATKLMDLNKIVNNLPKSGIIEFVDKGNINANNSNLAFENSVEGQYTYYKNTMFHKENGQLAVVTDLDWNNTLLYNEKGLYKYNKSKGLTNIMEYKEQTRFIHIDAFFAVNDYNPESSNNLALFNKYSDGDIVLVLNDLTSDLYLYAVKRPPLSVERLPLPSLDVLLSNIYFVCYGGLFKLVFNKKYNFYDIKNVTTNDSENIVIETGQVVFDSEADVIHAEEAYEDGSGNKVRQILCLDNSKIYNLYLNNGFESYHEAESLNKYNGVILFVDIYNKQIYYRPQLNRSLGSEPSGFWDAGAEGYHLLFDCSWQSGGIPSNYHNNLDFVTVDLVGRELSHKANNYDAVLRGTPIAPTAPSGTNTDQIATTKFVTNAINDVILNGTNIDLSNILDSILDSSALKKKTRIITVEEIEYGIESAVTNNYKSVICVDGSSVILFTMTDEAQHGESLLDYNQEIIDTSDNIIVIVSSSNRICKWDDDEEGFITVLDAEPTRSLVANESRPVSSYVVYNALNTKAPIENAQFTGLPTAPTPNISDDSDKIATTAYVKSIIRTLHTTVTTPGSSTEIYAVDAICDDTLDIVENNYNTAVQIDVTDVILWIKNEGVTVPASIDDYSSIILNTDSLLIVCDKILYKFDANQHDFIVMLNANQLVTSSINSGNQLPVTSSAIYNALNNKANKNNTQLTGVPTAPTATAGTDTLQIATTAFVKAAVDAAINSLDLSNIQTDINISDIPDNEVNAYKYNIQSHSWVSSLYDDTFVKLKDIKKLMDLGFVNALANYMVALDAKITELNARLNS